MEKADTPPKRPATAFFLFKQKEKEKGNNWGGKEASEKWHALTEGEKKKYFDEYNKSRERYDTYLEEVGLPRRSTAKKQSKPTTYKSSRIRGVCGMSEEVKDMTTKQYKALAAVAVRIYREIIGNVR